MCMNVYVPLPLKIMWYVYACVRACVCVCVCVGLCVWVCVCRLYMDIKITSQVQFVRKFIHIKPLEVSHNMWKASTNSRTRGKLA